MNGTFIPFRFGPKALLQMHNNYHLNQSVSGLHMQIVFYETNGEYRTFMSETNFLNDSLISRRDSINLMNRLLSIKEH